MTLSPRIPSRMLREAGKRQGDSEDLADFVIFLLDALEIPEVRDAVREALQFPRPSPVPRPQAVPSGRGVGRTPRNGEAPRAVRR